MKIVNCSSDTNYFYVTIPTVYILQAWSIIYKVIVFNKPALNPRKEFAQRDFVSRYTSEVSVFPRKKSIVNVYKAN